MSEYLDTRVEAMKLLDSICEIRDEYSRIAEEGGPGLATLLNEHLGAHLPAMQEGIQILGNDPRLQSVISAEPALGMQLQAVGNFWYWLRSNGIVTLSDKEPQQAATELPPRPGDEITGETVMTYLTELRAWLVRAMEELWDEDRPFEVPEIGQRYLIGDFNQAASLTHVLIEGQQLHEHWVQVADCGAYWDSVHIGSSRAKLIFKAVELLDRILHPVM